ncbi:hypothetical protein AA0313_1387 [Acetobacter indonesiensis NRIC 0313]|uniref:Uncharacterized protein n=1 Tax=Acetobacter indonesiensis TaxID=104101 RepID=A0A6N3T8Y1_9PROT|nr:hypothetical protein Abin_004_047 [Acetobacter indonesiensis]GBQ57180.1 hypothetical protein AA0313_1387 [Acetobacter indonesiensis NRIC 0313]GEN04508.1 hypothetical protein AIN02nite_25330 [Acetobacter indonesiensis]
MSGDLAPQDVIRLAQADQMALLSVLRVEQDPSYENIKYAKRISENFIGLIQRGGF